MVVGEVAAKVVAAVVDSDSGFELSFGAKTEMKVDLKYNLSNLFRKIQT